MRKRINVVRNEPPKSRSHVSKMGFVVVPSVSDGVLNLPSQREGATTEHSAQWGPECPECGQCASFAKTGNKRRFWQKRHTTEDVSKTRKSAMLSANADENNENNGNNGNNGNNDMVYVQWFSKLSEWL